MKLLLKCSVLAIQLLTIPSALAEGAPVLNESRWTAVELEAPLVVEIPVHAQERRELVALLEEAYAGSGDRISRIAREFKLRESAVCELIVQLSQTRRLPLNRPLEFRRNLDEALLQLN